MSLPSIRIRISGSSKNVQQARLYPNANFSGCLGIGHNQGLRQKAVLVGRIG